MIDTALAFLRDELNQYMMGRFDAPGPLVVIGPVVDREGAPSVDVADKLILTLVNLQRESAAGNSAVRHVQVGGDTVRVAQPLNLNIHILATANFETNYADALKVLSAVLRFFQARPVFTRNSSPSLPPELDRLSMEWTDMDLHEIFNLWSVLGGRYLPSVVYKARMLVVRDGEPGPGEPVVTALGVRT